MSENVSEVLSTMPLWERIKIHVYEQYVHTLDMEYLVNKDLAKRRQPKAASDFVASVLRLYMTLAPKVTYPGKKQYDMLLKLEDYMEKPQDLSIRDAKIYFRYMRELLEDLGITKIEVRSRDAGENVVGGLGR